MSKKDAIQKSINKIRNNRSQLDISTLVDGVLKGDLQSLATSITLLESTNPQKRQQGQEILDKLMPHTGKAKRIGITGVPGVGKSTFIESFGKHLIKEGYKIAVLAVDPSSQVSGGSILGDKTRMEELSISDKAFIRPSPAGTTLGGVAARTRESILLCEAAGFDIILVETVGVGQSETSVHSMVDFFLLLMLAGAGDDLQGIKRGIMEMADMIVINKADGDNVPLAKQARINYKNALHLFPPRKDNWIPNVQLASGLNNEGTEDIWKEIERFYSDTAQFIDDTRKEQNTYWFKEAVNDLILHEMMNNSKLKSSLITLEAEVKNGYISAFGAAQRIMKTIKNV